MNKVKVGYFASTGLLSLMLSMSVGMYFIKHSEISAVFVKLGYPANMVYPLAVAKILGIIAIWSRKSKTLVEFSYAGFFYTFLLAFYAHVSIGDGQEVGALVALVLLTISYFTQKKHYK
ncbi:hypothetical protein A9Q84_11235 [Halobacteriovorax marinus]|uniref:DoxX-like family protein n=1 Tax=Halobacteriovorax marinus TaxID=97084 RepID=A0A1Y5FE76_9BACT|nr:hypothetical protein A9Q84_11235 [Halobacteriovorax marinus]